MSQRIEDRPIYPASVAQAMLSVRDLVVAFQTHTVLREISVDIAPGELLAVLGPSGSGKTTLLNAVAGFIRPRSGTISLDGELVSGPGLMVDPEKRELGMVFQSYALWPHMTVQENVAFPLRRRGMHREEAMRHAVDLLAKLGLEEKRLRHPGELSGGEQQRVGLARALAAHPRLFLFDEPTANLDAALKTNFLREIRSQQRESGTAALYVTHDVREAFTIADRVLVLLDGRVAQIGTPVEIYEAPVGERIAGLSGIYSLLPGQIETTVDASGATVRMLGERFHVALTGQAVSAIKPGTGARFMLRPEWGKLSADVAEGLPASVTAVRFQGALTEYELEIAEHQIFHREIGTPQFAAGDQAHWRPLRAVIFPD